MGHSAITTTLAALLLGCGGAPADSEPTPEGSDWITLSTASGADFPAYVRVPEGADGSVRAVVYNHGKQVEQSGIGGATDAGYDVTDFGDAFFEAGYAVIVPVRASGSQADDGIFDAALDHLVGHAQVAGQSVSMVGFSRGGLLSLEWAVAHPKRLVKLVLLAPAPGVGTQLTDTFDDLAPLTAPVFAAHGEDEPNPAIVSGVAGLVAALQDLGKTEQHTIYPGADHEWFWTVRPDYLDDVLAFLQAP